MNYFFFLDQQLFLILNHLPHNEVLNFLGLALSGVGTLGIIWFVLGIILFLREERKDHWFFAPLVLTGLGTLVFADGILKPLVARLRPTVEMGAIILGNGSTDFSFPSGHATMSFAAAVVLSREEPRWKWLFYLLAIAISFSRIYIGKHYPADVLAGAILGIIIGWLSLMLTSFGRRSQVRRQPAPLKKIPFT